ncbi:PocR sensory domain-containing protein [Evansella caseinilytica]|uniref:PocR sensory domain-containing protein n=1 Tax=Evansella caseinilytica TaxID=1503961 RepID=A0A1H3I4Q8_9BACI|nr:helix-turn-helix transcriptional regulator [Evansella caseinilytica]SDY22602.1 PocR sensory domain-containing protein [Evansella caseinilytica]
MKKNRRFIQDLQDAYAAFTELTLVILDLDGNEFTEVSGFTPLTKLGYEIWGSKETYQEYFPPLHTLTKTTVFDNRIGLKLVVSPIRIYGQTAYCLVGGYLLGERPRPLIEQAVNQEYSHIPGLAEAIKALPELSPEEVSEKLEKVTKLAELAETFLALQQQREYSEQQTSFISQNLTSMRCGTATVTSFLEKLKEVHPGLDFVGTALAKENRQYDLEIIRGEAGERLTGQELLTGESFVGTTVASRRSRLWKKTGNELRIQFFHRHKLYPKQLFCIPVYNENTIIGTLFGGTGNEGSIDRMMLEQMEVNSLLLSTLLTSQALQTNLQNHLMELSTFNEIFRVIPTVKDMKRLLYILVDVSINIIRGPFSCIVYKPASSYAKVDIVSRGLTATEINEYGHDVAHRTFSSPEMDVKKIVKRKTNWGTDVLEFPLHYKDKFYGMLCLGIHPKDDADKYKAILSSLAMAGSISIHLCQGRKEERNEDNIVTLLYDVVNQHDPQKYMMLKNIKNIVEAFADFLDEDPYEPLKKVSGLVCYDLSFVEKYIDDQELLMILDGFHKVLNRQKAMRRDSQILALAYHFVAHGENTASVTELVTVSEALRQQFVSFIDQQSIVETHIPLETVNAQLACSEEKKEDSGLILKNKLNLSSREIEVLNYVLKGFNNREIADVLYISEHTVKNHITRILQKLEVTDRAQAIAMIYQLGYSPPQ